MKNRSINTKNKGSVLIAVIGILAVLSVMALRFNVEMETAMIKTTGKNISTDIRVLANSGLMYTIKEILLNGSKSNPMTVEPLKIEEEMENIILGASGIPEVVKKYDFGHFNGGGEFTTSSFVTDDDGLYPGKVDILVEDLSAKLPVGHISQWFQRHLMSATLCHLLKGTVPSDKNNGVVTELFEDSPSNSIESKTYDETVLVKSLVPYDIAKKLFTANSSDTSHFVVAGIPLADGIQVVEELGSSYTWLKGSSSNSTSKVIATDYPRSTTDYLKLSSSLTPYARFVHDKEFQEANSTLGTPVSHASINPVIMRVQNPELYKSLFYYDPVDFRLKRYFSVSFDPIDKPTDTINNTAFKGAMAKTEDFAVRNNADEMISVAMPSMVINTLDKNWTGNSLTYNARNDSTDLHLSSQVSKTEKVKTWSDPEFANAPSADTAYYLAMDKAVERLGRVFKTLDQDKDDPVLPATGMMLPIVTRKTLEFAIINAVFGDAISFADKNGILFEEGGIVNYFRLLDAFKNNEINLDCIKFVENAFTSNNDDPNMKDLYFVPLWENYKVGVNGSKFTKGGNAEIKVPSFGFFEDKTKTGAQRYVNYLPHPQTNQKKLDNVYVSLVAAYSHKHISDVPAVSNNNLLVPSLYTVNTVNGFHCKMKVSDTYDATLDLSSFPFKVQSIDSSTATDFMELNYITLDATNNISDANFKPADFTPYETKIRMAVLVNLLNAIIPEKVSETKFLSGYNDTLFVTDLPTSIAKTLKDFIYFKDGEYKVNTNADVGLNQYLNGWAGGIKTPGMTFWKFGVHSTTFQVTIDAFKYDDSVRLSTVLTFDTEVISNSTSPYTWDNTKPKYKLDKDMKEEIYSNIYLNTLGRQVSKADDFSIGKGELRYPKEDKTKGWRILSSVWSNSYGRNAIYDYFVRIDKYPEQAANVGPKGVRWNFVPHPMEGGFTRFFTDSNGKSGLSGGGSWGDKNDYSDGTLKTRNRSYGANSWLKWEANFTKTMDANKLTMYFRTTRPNNNNSWVQKHEVKLVFKKNNTTYTYPFSTSTGSPTYTMKFPVKLEKGEYDIYLTEMNESSTAAAYGDEVFEQLSIYDNGGF